MTAEARARASVESCAMATGRIIFRPRGAITRSAEEDRQNGCNKRFMDEFCDSKMTRGNWGKEGSRHVIWGQNGCYIVEPGNIDIFDVPQITLVIGG